MKGAPPRTKVCVGCGAEVEGFTRFHRAPPFTDAEDGHYTDPPKGAQASATASRSADPAWPHQGPAPDPWPQEKPALGGSESELVLYPCMELLTALGFKVWKNEQSRQGDSARTTPGIADLYATGHGVTAWIECKRWDGTQSEAQEGFERAVVSNGGIYLLVYETSQITRWFNTLK